MNITDIRIRRTYSETRLKALISITIDKCFAVHDIKIIEGPERLFVAMPSRKDDNGVYRDIAHPIDNPTREMLEAKLLQAYMGHMTLCSNKEVNCNLTESSDDVIERIQTGNQITGTTWTA